MAVVGIATLGSSDVCTPVLFKNLFFQRCAMAIHFMDMVGTHRHGRYSRAGRIHSRRAADTLHQAILNLSRYSSEAASFRFDHRTTFMGRFLRPCSSSVPQNRMVVLRKKLEKSHNSDSDS